VIKVQATIYSTDWAFAQDVDSLDASFASPKKTATSKRIDHYGCAAMTAQALNALSFFIDLIFCDAPALPQNLLQGFGPAAVRSRQLTAALM
jgi:hypothetical protein